MGLKDAEYSNNNELPKSGTESMRRGTRGCPWMATRGFSKAIGEAKRDFVTLSQRKGIRFMRGGNYPVLRGTLISLTEDQHLLFTSGYTPRIRTYPGHSVPQPLFITHIGDSEIKDICEEILGLTKLNWNTTSFSTYLPITLAFLV